MKIDRASLHGPAPVRRKEKTGGTDAGFADNLASAGQGGATQSASRSGGVSNMDSLLALQEVPDAADNATRGRQRGERVLARLEDLRDGLLAGRMAADTVRRLADEVAAARAEVEDQRLADILDEIDLRAQVELAKLRR